MTASADFLRIYWLANKHFFFLSLCHILFSFEIKNIFKKASLYIISYKFFSNFLHMAASYFIYWLWFSLKIKLIITLYCTYMADKVKNYWKSYNNSEYNRN